MCIYITQPFFDVTPKYILGPKIRLSKTRVFGRIPSQTLFIFYFYIDILRKFSISSMFPIHFKTGLPHLFFLSTHLPTQHPEVLEGTWVVYTGGLVYFVHQNFHVAWHLWLHCTPHMDKEIVLCYLHCNLSLLLDKSNKTS